MIVFRSRSRALSRKCRSALAVMFLACIGAAWPAVSATASPIPDGHMVEVSLDMNWAGQTTKTFTNGRQEVTPSNAPEHFLFRMFQVKGEMIVSFRDFQAGRVYVDGKQKTKSAYRAGNGTYNCTRIERVNLTSGDMCFMFRRDGEFITLNQRYRGADKDLAVATDKMVRLKIMPGNCSAELVSSGDHVKILPSSAFFARNPHIRNHETRSAAVVRGSGCLVSKGRAAF